MTNNKIAISNHSIDRMKERLGVCNTKSCILLAQKAYSDGITLNRNHDDYDLHNFVHFAYDTYIDICCIKLLMNMVFIFGKSHNNKVPVLITILTLSGIRHNNKHGIYSKLSLTNGGKKYVHY